MLETQTQIQKQTCSFTQISFTFTIRFRCNPLETSQTTIELFGKHLNWRTQKLVHHSTTVREIKELYNAESDIVNHLDDIVLLSVRDLVDVVLMDDIVCTKTENVIPFI